MSPSLSLKPQTCCLWRSIPLHWAIMCTINKSTDMSMHEHICTKRRTTKSVRLHSLSFNVVTYIEASPHSGTVALCTVWVQASRGTGEGTQSCFCRIWFKVWIYPQWWRWFAPFTLLRQYHLVWPRLSASIFTNISTKVLILSKIALQTCTFTVHNCVA